MSSDFRLLLLLDVTVQPPLAREHELECSHAAPHLVYHLFLHQVEAHGNKRHAQHQVHGAEYETHVDFLTPDHSFPWNYVSKPNRAEADEAKVRTVQEVPAFPLREQNSAEADVPTAENKTLAEKRNYYNEVLCYEIELMLINFILSSIPYEV